MAIVRSEDGRFFDIDDSVLAGKEIKPADLPRDSAYMQQGQQGGRGGSGGGRSPQQIVINIGGQGGGSGGGRKPEGQMQAAGAPAGASGGDVKANYCYYWCYRYCYWW